MPRSLKNPMFLIKGTNCINYLSVLCLGLVFKMDKIVSKMFLFLGVSWVSELSLLSYRILFDRIKLVVFWFERKSFCSNALLSVYKKKPSLISSCRVFTTVSSGSYIFRFSLYLRRPILLSKILPLVTWVFSLFDSRFTISSAYSYSESLVSVKVVFKADVVSTFELSTLIS